MPELLHTRAAAVHALCCHVTIPLVGALTSGVGHAGGAPTRGCRHAFRQQQQKCKAARPRNAKHIDYCGSHHHRCHGCHRQPLAVLQPRRPSLVGFPPASAAASPLPVWNMLVPLLLNRQRQQQRGSRAAASKQRNATTTLAAPCACRVGARPERRIVFANNDFDFGGGAADQAGRVRQHPDNTDDEEHLMNLDYVGDSFTTQKSGRSSRRSPFHTSHARNALACRRTAAISRRRSAPQAARLAMHSASSAAAAAAAAAGSRVMTASKTPRTSLLEPCDDYCDEAIDADDNADDAAAFEAIEALGKLEAARLGGKSPKTRGALEDEESCDSGYDDDDAEGGLLADAEGEAGEEEEHDAGVSPMDIIQRQLPRNEEDAPFDHKTKSGFPLVHNNAKHKAVAAGGSTEYCGGQPASKQRGEPFPSSFLQFHAKDAAMRPSGSAGHPGTPSKNAQKKSCWPPDNDDRRSILRPRTTHQRSQTGDAADSDQHVDCEPRSKETLQSGGAARAKNGRETLIEGDAALPKEGEPPGCVDDNHDEFALLSSSTSSSQMVVEPPNNFRFDRSGSSPLHRSRSAAITAVMKGQQQQRRQQEEASGIRTPHPTAARQGGQNGSATSGLDEPDITKTSKRKPTRTEEDVVLHHDYAAEAAAGGDESTAIHSGTRNLREEPPHATNWSPKAISVPPRSPKAQSRRSSLSDAEGTGGTPTGGTWHGGDSAITAAKQPAPSSTVAALKDSGDESNKDGEHNVHNEGEGQNLYDRLSVDEDPSADSNKVLYNDENQPATTTQTPKSSVAKGKSHRDFLPIIESDDEGDDDDTAPWVNFRPPPGAVIL